MKAILSFLSLIAIGFAGCKVKSPSGENTEKESTIVFNCNPHNIQTSHFSGIVKDLSNNEDFPYAVLELQSANRQGNYGATTDSDGKFSFNNIPFGPYHLIVQYPGYQVLRKTVMIKQNSNCTAEIKLHPMVMRLEKPVIYLYPTQTQKIHVQLKYAGSLTHTYPKYPNDGWHVSAQPNGTLFDEKGTEYYALFWEGIPQKQIIPKDGFVVAGEETAEFLEEKLAYLGLNRREANEFMMYWLPRMEDHPYNFIHFAGNEYEALAALEITPKPETVIRVMMLTQPLNNKVNVPLQDLSPLKKLRKGYTVVEWGGSEIESLKL